MSATQLTAFGGPENLITPAFLGETDVQSH